MDQLMAGPQGHFRHCRRNDQGRSVGYRHLRVRDWADRQGTLTWRMTNQFSFDVPRGSEPSLKFTLGPGDVMYMLGANGSGKSSLVSQLFNAHQASAKRISAHRQTWFNSNSLDMTPHSRESVEQNIRNHDRLDHARYRLDYAHERASVAIYDLIDADTMLARKIADLVRAGNILGAESQGKVPAPIQVINELMRLSNIPIEIALEERQKVVARKNGGAPYSVAELSDGERNAFLIAADILTTKSGTLLLIDEPERHLHRSIISPLLRLLFDKRRDCAFIVSTHELMLPLDTPSACTLLVRGCEYAGQAVKSWSIDLLEPGTEIDELLKADLLGARRKIVFVEGKASSLDAPLYSLLFPEVSILPKESCKDVEHAVQGLRGVPGLHWVQAWGIIDNDQRSPEEMARLRSQGVWALSHYSVEAFYYHQLTIKKVANRQSGLTGADADALMAITIPSAIDAVREQRNNLVASAVLRSTRREFMSRLPKSASMIDVDSVEVMVDTKALREAEERRFDSLIAAQDWDGLLTRYPVRQSRAFDSIVKTLKVADKETYRAAVLKLLQDDADALKGLRDLMGDLFATISA